MSKERIRIFYRKNLKMSAGKLASQSVHAALMLRGALSSMDCIVFGVSDYKFRQMVKNIPGVKVFADAGKTEVAPGTETCLAYIEEVDDRDE